MAAKEHLKELNMTADEVDRFKKAFKDENFRQMLHDYAQEISDPENKKLYEEDIKRLEQERGNTVDFIHPEPFRAIKTSVNGKQICFINICCSEKVGKPECKTAVSKDGRRGQCWSLPHSLHPGREDTDRKGNKILIYDVVFHPDTLHITRKSKRFMDMVESTAIQGIQQAFEVSLDETNVKKMKTKYKGTPQACVIRKPIPGYNAREPSEHADPLAFPYPDETTPATMQQSVSNKPSQTKWTTNENTPSFKAVKAQEPTKPNYRVKYRSFIDLQDFTYSRDSAQSHRPKEIVVTIDLPLLKSAGDCSLEVKDQQLLMESKRSAYRLELPLAYPVDEDKGQAKFIKQRGQLVVTLLVLPPNAASDFSGINDGFQSVGDGEGEAKSHGMEDKDHGDKEKENEKMCFQEKMGETQMNKMDVEEERKVKKGQEEVERSEEKMEDHVSKGGGSDEDQSGTKKPCSKQIPESVAQDREERVTEQKQVDRKEDGSVVLLNKDKLREDMCDRAAEENDCSPTEPQCHASVLATGISTGKEKTSMDDDRPEASPKTEKQLTLISAEDESEVREDQTGSTESTPTLNAFDVPMEPEETEEAVAGNLQVINDAACLDLTSHEESQATAAVSFTPSGTNMANQNSGIEHCMSKTGAMSSHIPATGEASETSADGSNKGFSLQSGEHVTDSVGVQETEDRDEDDIPAEQNVQTSLWDKLPPILLREIDKDGNETVISDHSTSAGFNFQNSLMFELD